MQKILQWMVLSIIALTAGSAPAQESPFLGRWALTPEGGGAGWLEVGLKEGSYTGSLLWMGGSPEPQTRVYLDGDTLHGLRIVQEDLRDASGRVTRTQPHPISFTATLDESRLSGTLVQPATNGAAVYKTPFLGVRIPALPPAPDLANMRFGAPIYLFNGRDLEGWVVSGGAHWGTLETPAADGRTDGWIPNAEGVANGWSVQDGILKNDPVQQAGQPHKVYGNLMTREVFEDFRLSLEVKVPPDGNSGVYLRGIYEIQLRDSFGKPLDPHNMGAVYGRITPTEARERPAGEWQSLEITLVDRHVTVQLNGGVVIDNQPVAGCTGGALWSDESRPGPLYFQGDHTSVQLRNITLRPVLR